MRSRMIKKILVAVILFASACKHKEPEERLKDFVEDPVNKITQKIMIGDVGIVTKFLPAPYRLLMNSRKDSVGEDREKFYYFDVKLNKTMGEKPAKEKLLYLNFDMQNDFVLLVNDRDSIMPAICQKIENGIAGSYEYMVAFEKGGEEWKNFTLFYNDKIFGIGTVAFVFNEKDILNIPGLKRKIK
jgi:hypothetical protein